MNTRTSDHSARARDPDATVVPTRRSRELNQVAMRPDAQDLVGGDSSLARFVSAFADRPYAFDLRQALRRIDALSPSLPRLGEALRPGQEIVRIGQPPALDFAPAAWSSVSVDAIGRNVRLQQRVLGLLGPNGPLPLHLTEYAREREMHHGDRTFVRFLDLLVQRPALQFYRAWAQAQPVVGFDRPDDNRHAFHVGALAGDALVAGRPDTTLESDARNFFVGRLAGSVRSADGLAAWLSDYFEVPVAVEQCVPHWMSIDSAGLSSLGEATAGCAAILGAGAVLGHRVWDVQSRFRVEVGPVDAQAYASFLPGAPGHARMRALVRRYLGEELDWDCRVILRQDAVSPATLDTSPAGGRGIGRVGLGVWLGGAGGRDRGDLLVPGPASA